MKATSWFTLTVRGRVRVQTWICLPPPNPGVFKCTIQLHRGSRVQSKGRWTVSLERLGKAWSHRAETSFLQPPPLLHLSSLGQDVAIKEGSAPTWPWNILMDTATQVRHKRDFRNHPSHGQEEGKA